MKRKETKVNCTFFSFIFSFKHISFTVKQNKSKVPMKSLFFVCKQKIKVKQFTASGVGLHLHNESPSLLLQIF